MKPEVAAPIMIKGMEQGWFCASKDGARHDLKRHVSRSRPVDPGAISVGAPDHQRSRQGRQDRRRGDRLPGRAPGRRLEGLGNNVIPAKAGSFSKFLPRFLGEGPREARWRGFSAKEPLHHASHGPPPLQMQGRILRVLDPLVHHSPPLRLEFAPPGWEFRRRPAPPRRSSG